MTWDEHYRTPFAAAPRRGDASRRPTTRPALDQHRHQQDRRDHRRADPGRRRRAADLAGARQGHRGGVRAHRRAAHRRRDPVRHRPHRPDVRVSGPRPDAGPGLGRQGARRRLPDRRGARRRSRSRRPSRPAITARPTAATCSPAGRRSPSSTRSTAACSITSRRWAPIIEQGLQRHGGAPRPRRRGPRQGPDVGRRPRARRRRGRHRAPRPRPRRQPHGGLGDPPAAAVRHHRSRDRRRARAPRSARSPMRWEVPMASVAAAR